MCCGNNNDDLQPAQCERVEDDGHFEPHDSDYLFLAVEEDTEKAIVFILAALRNRKSADCRGSAIWLLECTYAAGHVPHVLRAMAREHRCRERCEIYLYVSFFLGCGERVLGTMLAIEKNTQRDAYSREVAKDFLTRFLSKPVA